MNEALKVIKSRRTTRKFKEEQIKEDEIKIIMESAIHAPSGQNSQPWNFTVIQNKEIIDELNNTIKEAFTNFPSEQIQKMGNNEKYNVFYSSPTVVLVSGNETAHTAVEDCAAATQNILLAAESLDIGACWIGVMRLAFNDTKFQELMVKFNLPQGYKPLHAICLGYKDMRPTNTIERKENVVQYIK